MITLLSGRSPFPLPSTQSQRVFPDGATPITASSEIPAVSEMLMGGVKVSPESWEVTRYNSLLEGDTSSTHVTRITPPETFICGLIEGVPVLDRLWNPEKLAPLSEDLAYITSLFPDESSSHTRLIFPVPSKPASGPSDTPGKAWEMLMVGVLFKLPAACICPYSHGRINQSA